MTDEYYAALSKENKVIKAEWFDSLIEAKKWAETCEEENYTVSIFKGPSDKPLLKYDVEHQIKCTKKIKLNAKRNNVKFNSIQIVYKYDI